MPQNHRNYEITNKEIVEFITGSHNINQNISNNKVKFGTMSSLIINEEPS